MRIDYTCAECGAAATTVDSRVMVPHGPKCPVGARLAELAAKAQRCQDPDCDGPALHDGPHYQWVPE
jgi:hypothetical protein